jgi:hypothetical protein
MQRDERERPLSIRLDPKAWIWLRRESKRRTEATGVRVGPSSIVRAIVEREADQARPTEDIIEFRKRWQVESLGLTRELFEDLRDRSPGRDVRL